MRRGSSRFSRSFTASPARALVGRVPEAPADALPELPPLDRFEGLLVVIECHPLQAHCVVRLQV